MKITLKHLQVFVAVAQSNSLTEGANAIYLSQPAASSCLSDLETQLGVPLFDRRGKRLVLNGNGSQLYPKAAEVLERSRAIESLFHHRQAELTGHIRVGMSSTIGNYVAPALIARFIQAYPHIRISQTIANSEDIVSGLEKFKLDIGFIESECYSAELDTQPWGIDEVVIFAAKAHPLAMKKRLTHQDVEQASWVMRERGSGTRQVLEKYLHPQHIALEIDSTQAIKKIVANSRLLGCASRHALVEELQRQDVVALSVPALTLQRRFYRLLHRDQYCTDALQQFVLDCQLPDQSGG